MESDLPLEVLCQILSHVPPLERLSASLVCRRWLQAADTFLEDVQKIIGDHGSLATHRPFSRIVFRSMVIDAACADFLNRLGPKLLHLRFVNCWMDSPLLTLVDCPRLRTLETDCGDLLLIFTSLPNLVNLKIKEADDLMLITFDTIAGPHLEVFVMPNSTDYEWFDNEMHLDLEDRLAEVLEDFVARRSTTLTTLHLPKNITTVQAVCLSKLDGLQLKTVFFGGPVDIPTFCFNQRSIVTINTDRSTSLNDQHVAEICHLLPELLEFSANTPNLNIDRSIVDLLRLRHLRVLRLRYGKIAPVSFPEAIPMLELRTLDLGHTQIRDDQIRSLLSLAPQLEELDLTGCDVSDVTLVLVCPLLPQLRELVLEECKGVGDVGLRAFQNLTRLEKLILNYCGRRLTSTGVKECVRFRFLKELGLKGCAKVSKNVLKPLKAHNPCLTILSWH